MYSINIIVTTICCGVVSKITGIYKGQPQDVVFMSGKVIRMGVLELIYYLGIADNR